MNYKVDFINPSYRRFFAAHREEIMAAFERCASKGDFMLRDDTREFERKLADYVGTKYAVAVNSGTDALFLSLKALGIGPGDEVITVSHTFIATIQAIVHTGATPILVDVGEDELMDLRQVREVITNNTKAIIPVHFHGKVCDMDYLFSLEGVENGGIKIVEDAAQALGAVFCSYRDGCRAGSFGDMGCFSFNFPKLMGCYGDGGAITTNDEDVYKKLLLLRNHWNITQGSVDSDRYPQPEEMQWGWKSRMDNIQAAILNIKFKYLDEMIARRKEISNMYDEGLKNVTLKLPTHQDGEVVQEYVIQNFIIDREAAYARLKPNAAFKKFMDAQGIEVLVRDSVPNHKLKGLNLDHFSLPVTERLARESVRLPVYPELRNDEVAQVIKAVKKYYD